MRSIGTKITGIVGISMLLVSAVIVFSVYSIYRQHMEEMTETSSELALYFDLAIRDYVAQEIRPRMYDLLPDGEFVPETMSTSYVAQSVFQRLGKRFPEYILKFSSDNPRNPANLAGPEEEKVLKYFRDNPGESDWSGRVVIEGRRYLGRFRARRVGPSCLPCHGDPADAPVSLLERYGKEAGFHLQVGDVAGMDTVAIPLDDFFLQVFRESRWSLLTLLSILVLGVAVIVIALRVIIVSRLTAISRHIVSSTTRGDYSKLEPLEVAGGDEISVLAESFNILTERLGKKYSLLEVEVRERAERLEHGNEQLVRQLERYRRSQKALQESETKLKETSRFYRTVLDSMHDPVAIVNVGDKRVVGVNSVFLDFYGKDAAEVVGEECRTAIRGSDSACRSAEYECPLEKAMSGGGYYLTEQVHCGRDGKDVQVEVSTSPVLDSEGNVVQVVLVVRDISARKASEAAQEAGRLAAEDASRAKGQFLANMSHEIRTPLNGIIGMSELALDTAFDEDQKKIFTTINSEAGSLMSMVNDVLDFSKIESGRLELEENSFDMRHLVEDLANTIALQAERRGLEFNSYFAPDLPVRVVGDPGRLRQIILNLASNALKFTEEGEIFVRAELDEDLGAKVKVRFSVKDTGIGIEPEKQVNIFESFIQADGSTTRRYGGTGLGMAIARQLAELMEGKISLTSRPGKGTTVRVTAVFVKGGEESQSAPRKPFDLGGLRVLLVDDSRTSLSVLKSYLGLSGCRTEEVSSGEEALAVLGRAHASAKGFNLVITDHRMAGMNGFTLAQRMREKNELRDVPVILLTSMGSLGDGRRCREAGIQGYLAKPVGQEELREAVAAVMGQSAAGAEKESWSLVSRHSLAEERIGGELQILVVEDYPTIQEILLMHLRCAGCEVDLAENGEEAVEAFRRKHYDLILMDIQMPVMDGYEATRAIRQLEKDRQGTAAAGEKPSRVSIIAITARAAKEDEERCYAAGMDGYLAKPVKRRALLDAVSKLGTPEGAPENPPAAQPEGGEDLSALDLAQVLDEFQGREDFLFGAIERFLRDVRGQVAQMRRAVDQGDAQTVLHEAHSVKGAARFLTAERLADTAFKLESAGRSEDLAPAPGLLDRIEEEARSIEDLVHERRKRG